MEVEKEEVADKNGEEEKEAKKKEEDDDLNETKNEQDEKN
jgi:hypothetical protein